MILIIGGSGFIGYYLHHSFLSSKQEVISTYNTKKIEEEKFIQLDITNKSEITKTIKKIKPNTIIYAAGLTDVDLCENNHELAKSINCNGIKNIIEAAKKFKSKIIYISTSAVFDGTKKVFIESDETNPISYYGKSKLEGEKVVQNSGLPYTIIRTDQPYGWKKDWHHTNSMLRIIEKLEKNITHNEIIDWYNTPTSIEDIVKMTRKLLENNCEGIFHIVSDDFLSRVEFAEVVAEVFGLNKNNIKKIHSDELKLSAKRPNVRLKNSKKVDMKMNISNIFEGLKKVKEMRT